MSDFLKSLVARQFGEAASVRPRLAGRFEPPPDAFAPEAFPRAAGRDDPDSEALELFLEVETHNAPTRDNREDSRAPRHETDDTKTRVVLVREPREESQRFLRREQSSEHDSERTHDAASPSDTAEPRTQSRAREEGDARARPKSVVPSFDDEIARDSNERARAARTRAESDAESAEPVRPSTQTRDTAPFVARTRGDRPTPSSTEPREPSSNVDETQRPSTFVQPAPTSATTQREADGPSRASEESSLKRIEPSRTRESARPSGDADEAHAPSDARRGRESSATIEPKHAPRRERRTAARDTSSARSEVAPTINVTIGRVEVRATQAQAHAPRRAEGPAAPRMSLDEYLRRRSGEVRE